MKKNNINHALYTVGDVFQITEMYERKGWIGAFVLAERTELWGIFGFIPHIKTNDEQSRIYIRLLWEQIEFIGHAPLLPEDVAPPPLEAA